MYVKIVFIGFLVDSSDFGLMLVMFEIIFLVLDSVMRMAVIGGLFLSEVVVELSDLLDLFDMGSLIL